MPQETRLAGLAERAQRLKRRLSDPKTLKSIAIDLAVAWFTVACAGYALALYEFSKIPHWALTSASRRVSGPISELDTHGFGASRVYRFRINDSVELTVPEELAYPIWSGNKEPRRQLGDILREGQDVAVAASGGKFAVVLELSLNLPGGMQEKLLDMQDSINRFGMVRAAATRKVPLFFALAAAAPIAWAAYRLRKSRARKSRPV